MSGHIEAIFGPMFSGKSTELQRKIRRYRFANKRCLVLNFHLDNRYSIEEVAVTHDKNMIDARKLQQLGDLTDEEIANHDVIAIDEGQFFVDLVEKAEEWANKGKIVIVAALDATFERRPFGNVCDLLAISEIVEKLSSICVLCGNNGHFTQRTSNSMDLKVVGGLEMYRPVCRTCFVRTEPQMHHSVRKLSVCGQSLNTISGDEVSDLLEAAKLNSQKSINIGNE